MDLNDKFSYLIAEANNFNTGSAWGFSTYGTVIHETVVRVYEKITNTPYPYNENRTFRLFDNEKIVELAKKENDLYENSIHTKTYILMNEMIEILEKS